ncbi:MAG: rRNA (guanine527-N7)-methyltransferase [Moorella sp. (in: firmicutes)]|uniref:16S rRNA (guanine(527)-N(7))-methyltransferase RsmG n=1 Tax=unclassified Neomoorella TaxID=2676739 RepID=UPI0010FFB770|nr:MULTISPECIES: 16S rRNA (guanine(527)-N(7))-methyltransferase RsmG [unclassified Moorella (in: firmicutes)]MDK2817334.1 rRNA (guanine527-N7)-methyltransferase [Moorella sp. (in: firmicutes)]MDK2894118.1 rRNA (guanine527-N7)-methyltransferase [Moorella sp. (in: firmicutes)]GEA14457.1 ribosomal RNA small subunit methyltransferase G [Moorella sp. E308F]GEA18171.1 ribosomal RNA small subunit methyltransferase G [Moorella sp. E306M]
MLDKNKIINNLSQNTGIDITVEQAAAIKAYIDLLVESNQQMNLTAIVEEEEIWRKHILDSLLIFCALAIPTGARVIDVGTGAGIPGFILKIYRPDLQLTLLEAQQKKVKFLEKVVNKLELKGVECLWSRAEEVGQNKNYREKYNLAVARAVAPLNTLAEYCLPLVKVEGFMVAYKGPAGEQELKAAAGAINLLGGGATKIWQRKLPGGEEKRLLVIIKKEKVTPPAYPRRPGLPAKRPLK